MDADECWPVSPAKPVTVGQCCLICELRWPMWAYQLEPPHFLQTLPSAKLALRTGQAELGAGVRECLQNLQWRFLKGDSSGRLFFWVSTL